MKEVLCYDLACCDCDISLLAKISGYVLTENHFFVSLSNNLYTACESILSLAEGQVISALKQTD